MYRSLGMCSWTMPGAFWEKDDEYGMTSYGKRMKAEWKSCAFWRDVFVEFLGTFLLMSFQSYLPISWGSEKLGNVVQVALGMGFLIFVLASSLGEFGGAHFNPAVTFSMLTCGKITINRAVLYMLVQSGGAVCGAGFISLTTPDKHQGLLAATMIHPSMTVVQGFFIETWTTFMLCMVVHSVTSDANYAIPPLAIGLCVSLDIMATFESTGASMNPARSLGPAVITMTWDNHWVYWAAPFAGAALASFIRVAVIGNMGKLRAPTRDEDDDAKSNNNKPNGGASEIAEHAAESGSSPKKGNSSRHRKKNSIEDVPPREKTPKEQEEEEDMDLVEKMMSMSYEEVDAEKVETVSTTSSAIVHNFPRRSHDYLSN